MKKIIIAILIFFVAIYFLLIQNFSDVVINKYSDLTVVKENKVIEKGWIPAILPESAYNIAETHDIDTQTLLGSFYYKEKDENTFLEKLTLVADMNETYEWKNFLFRIDKKNHYIKFRNKPKK